MRGRMFSGVAGLAGAIAQGQAANGMRTGWLSGHSEYETAPGSISLFYACTGPHSAHFSNGGISKKLSLNLASDAMCVAANLVKTNYFCELSEAAKLVKATRTLAPRYQVGALDIDGHSGAGCYLTVRTEANQSEIKGIASDPGWGGFRRRAGAGIALRLACEEGRR